MNNSNLSSVRTLFFILSLVVLIVDGSFTQTSCASSISCVEQNSKGTWCYTPDPSITQSLSCNGEPGSARDPTMAVVMGVHLQQGLSIAYYNGIDNTLLGGANFSVPTSGGVVRLCTSGKAGDGSFQTLCEDAYADNTIYTSGVHSFCAIAVGQAFVSDGCYVPSSAAAGTPNSLTSTLTSASLTTLTGATIKTVTSNGAIQTVIVSQATLTGATVETVTTNGATQTVIVAQASTSAGSNINESYNYAENIILPIILSLFGVIVFALGVFVWWYRQRVKERKANNVQGI